LRREIGGEMKKINITLDAIVGFLFSLGALGIALAFMYLLMKLNEL
jgi:hypothetical protein